MGCICSKGSFGSTEFSESAHVKGLILHLEKSSGALSKKEEAVVEVGGATTHGAVRRGLMQVAQPNVGLATNPSHPDIKTAGVQRPPSTHVEVKSGQMPMSRVFSVPHGTAGEHVLAGWPSWLTSVAGEAIKGWVPRRAESFEKLDKIGQGTYSSVYKARDLETGKIVAMKKVRFVNMDPESVRFMAREIYILRKLDHPNVMKLEGLVISRMSCCLYLIFEYMDHDLAGLAASRSVKFTEPQIKCYMRQLLCGLEHCHSRGVLHRDIKGSNLLIDNNGVLKIGDFGLATLFRPDQSQPLTTHVVTLWYRAPELLLGAVKYGFGIDLWSTGCILAELYTGKPIMPGRTEVEQMHKIFKLCGSPSEEYWKRSKLTHATSFKPQHPYPRCITETFQNFPPSALALVDKLLAIESEDRGSAAFALDSEFFKTKPLPCEPSSIPKYPPSKEFNVKVPHVATRKRAESVKGRGPESVRRGTITRGLRASKEVPTLDSNSQGQGQSNHESGNGGYNGSGFPFEPPKKTLQTTSVIHPNVVQLSLTKKTDDANMGVGQPSSRTGVELRTQNRFRRPTQGTEELSKPHCRMDIIEPGRELAMDYLPKKNRINFSGPLLPPRDNMDDMLKEHERQIQQAVRKARLDKFRTQKGYDQYENYEVLIQHIQNAG